MKTDSEPHSVTSAGAEAAAPTQPASPPAGSEPPPSVPPAPPTGRPAPFSPRARFTIVIAGTMLGLLFLLRIAGVLTPFLWAVVVAYAFNPLVGALCRRLHMPRGAVVGAIYGLGIGGLIGLLTVTVPALNQQVTQLANELPGIVRDLQDRYFGTNSQSLVIAGQTIDVPKLTNQLADSLNSALTNIVGGTFNAAVGTVERVTQFLLFAIVSFYLLLDAPRIGGYFAQLIPADHREELLALGHKVDSVLSQYLRAQLLLITIMGTASFIVLSVMGVRFAIVLAPVVGVLEIFPIIGPFAAITLVTLIALFSPPHYGLSHTTSALIVALVFFSLRQVEDYAVIPNVVGHAVRLHPALILFAVAVGATLGGALGLFLAVPVTGALKVLSTYIYQKMVPE